MVIAAVETRDHVVHIGQGAVREVILVTGYLSIIAAIVASRARAASGQVIDIGDIYPGLARIELGMNGQSHQAPLRPGACGSSGKILCPIEVEQNPVALVTRVDLPYF